ncbi:MAG: ribosome biogenesis protein [Candidatus Thorarchaeota archaeon]|nr:MAG: ribosome biogenesis protein [Candidatus Thorarchaeota archaeon]
MTHLFKCARCGKYTLHDDACPICGGHVKDPQPARFSVQDKYGEYRRRAKRGSGKVPAA